MSREYISIPNSSLLEDDLLLQLIQPIEHEYPAGPAFLHAISTVIEACVLHENNFFNPVAAGLISTGEANLDRVQSVIESSSLVKDLINGGALHRFPAPETVDDDLNKSGINYRWIDFVEGVTWSLESTSFKNTESEIIYVSFAKYLLNEVPGIFQSLELVGFDADEALTPEAQKLIELGFPARDLIFIETLNRRADAYQRLSRHMRLNSYSCLGNFLSQVGMIRSQNNLVFSLREKIKEQILPLEDDMSDLFDGANFTEAAMPGLVEIVLKKSKGDVSAISSEILALRESHVGLRRYLTDHDLEWQKALSKRQRIALISDFNNSWDSLIKSEKKPKDRIFYRLWDIVKEPAKILRNIGDVFAGRGREEYVVGQVCGLRAFWNDVLSAPVRSEARLMVSSICKSSASDDVWVAYQGFSEASKRYVSAKGRKAD